MPRQQIGPCLLLLLTLQGCLTTWKGQDIPPAELLTATGETQVQVRLRDGDRIVIRDPAVEGDSLIGWQELDGSTARRPPIRRAFALEDVQQVATRGNNTAPNVALGAATGFAVFCGVVVGLFLLTCGGGGCD